MNKISEIKFHLNQAQTLISSLKNEISEYESDSILETTNNNFELYTTISHILHDLSVPPETKGFKYLRDALIKVYTNPDYIDNVQKGLYVEIAKKFDTVPSNVERAIRHAIETSWLKGDSSNIESIVGYKTNKYDKPTNKNFLALVTERLHLKNGI